jgi:hydrogenase small subunit
MKSVKLPEREKDSVLSACSRRDFLKVCSLAAAAVGLPAWAGEAMAKDLAAGLKPSVIWLHFQECTGCTESLLRTSHPDVGELILDLISLDYHETLFAASGHQIEDALHQAIARYAGKYVLVVEGAIPLKDNGIYCQVAGKKAIDSLNECAEKAAAIIAIGSCASWGGIPSADPNPTGATGVPTVLKGKTVVCLPGCPANPYNLLGTVLQFATFGTLPKLDNEGNPLFAYARTIHEDCPRRAHFDAGRFAAKYGDEGHRLGYCLYKLGCKGPATHANCSLLSFGDVANSWPIGIGHPCYGCTEKEIAFRIPLNATIDVEHPTAPGVYPPIRAEQSRTSVAAAGVAGVLIGAAAGAAWVTSKKLSGDPAGKEQDKEDKKS